MMPAPDSINSNVFAVDEDFGQNVKTKESVEQQKSPSGFLNNLSTTPAEPLSQKESAPTFGAQPFAPVVSPSFNLNSIATDSPAAQNIINQFKERMNSIKPWKDFFSPDQFHLPQSGTAAQSRVSHNVNYFQNNYLMFVMLLSVFSLLSNFSLLFVAVILGVGFFYLSSLNPETTYNIAGQNINVKTMNYTWIAVCIIMLWMTSAISTVFWIGSVAAVFITAHAAIHDIPIESEFNTV